MASQDWFEKDFYAILGVPQDADAAAIKKTYRKKARTMHPDHNVGDDRAEERFKEVGEAYSVLSDPEKRREYDAVRAMSHGGARFTAGGPGGGGGAGFEDIFSGFGAGGAGAPGGGRVRFGPARPVVPAPVPASPISRTCSVRCSVVVAGRQRPCGTAGLRRVRSADRSPRGPGRVGERRASVSGTRWRGRPSASARPSSAASTPASPPGSRTGSGSDCAARAAAVTPVPGGRPHPHRLRRQAPGVRPRRRQPHRRPAGDLRRGGARCDGRGPDPRRVVGARQGRARARRAVASCASVAGA